MVLGRGPVAVILRRAIFLLHGARFFLHRHVYIVYVRSCTLQEGLGSQVNDLRTWKFHVFDSLTLEPRDILRSHINRVNMTVPEQFGMRTLQELPPGERWVPPAQWTEAGWVWDRLRRKGDQWVAPPGWEGRSC